MRQHVAATALRQPQSGVAPGLDLLRKGGALGRGHRIHWRPDAEPAELHRALLPG